MFWRLWSSASSCDFSVLLFDPVSVEHLFRVVVLDLGGIPQDLVVRGLQQLLASVVQLRANRLLHAGIVGFALPRWFLRNQLHDPESQQLLARTVYGDNGTVLSRLELHHCVPRKRIGSFQARLERRSQIAAVARCFRVF